MKVRAKLFGKLGRRFAGYQPDYGIDIEIPYGGKVKDLFAALGIPKSGGSIVIMKGHILRVDDALHESATVSVLQAFHGG
jgi:sulfur carrier protein ThiS